MVKKHSAKKLRDLKTQLLRMEQQLAHEVSTTDSGNMARYMTGTKIETVKAEISKLSM